MGGIKKWYPCNLGSDTAFTDPPYCSRHRTEQIFSVLYDVDVYELAVSNGNVVVSQTFMDDVSFYEMCHTDLTKAIIVRLNEFIDKFHPDVVSVIQMYFMHSMFHLGNDLDEKYAISMTGSRKYFDKIYAEIARIVKDIK